MSLLGQGADTLVGLAILKRHQVGAAHLQGARSTGVSPPSTPPNLDMLLHLSMATSLSTLCLRHSPSTPARVQASNSLQGLNSMPCTESVFAAPIVCFMAGWYVHVPQARDVVCLF